MNRWLKRVGRAAVFFLATYSGWVAAHWVFGAAREKPVWTEADLPPLPPANENGWHDAHEITISTPADLTQQVLDANGRGNVEAATEHRDAIDGFLLRDPAVHAKLEQLEAALDKPHFVDDCPLTLDARCNTVRWADTHRALLLRAYSFRWQDGNAVAVESIDRTLRADIEAARTSRTAISHMVALTALQEALETAEALLGAPGAAPSKALENTVSQLQPKDLDARRMVISEYVLIGRPDEKAMGEMLHLHPLMPCDAGRTDREIDRRARANYEGKPIPEPAREGEFWWVWNPRGKTMIDVMALEWPPLLERVAQKQKDIGELQKSILKRINSSRTPLPPP